MHLTFSCYGTLIDSDSGVLTALRPLLAAKQVDVTDEMLLTIFAEEETNALSGDYIPYYKVLRQVVRGFAYRYNFSLTHAEADSLADSIQQWQPFSDSAAALVTLKEAGHSLTVVTNSDTALFTHSHALLGNMFDRVVIAEEVRAYKPSIKMFRAALQKSDASIKETCHLGCSLFRDIVPASALGMQTVWINRRHNRGVSPPDAAAAGSRAGGQFNDLASFAAQLS